MAASMFGSVYNVLRHFVMNPRVSSGNIMAIKFLTSQRHKRILCLSNHNNNVIVVCHIHCNAAVRSWFRYIPKVKDAENKRKELSHTHLTKLLQKCKSVEEQFQAFNSYTELTTENISLRQSVCQDIQKIFKSYFPECTLHINGSTRSGLGLKGCDLDLSFQSPADENSECPTRDSETFLTKDIQEGKVPASKFQILQPKQKLHFLKRVLTESGFDEPATVIPGHCPILNFIYQSLSCDLAVDNKSALHGTNLMLLCRLLDDRVAPMCRFLMYWANYYKLRGGAKKFKSYAIFCLIIYFLQTRSPPVLPSVADMLDKTEFISNLDNWSYDVCKYLNRFESSKNSESTENLIQEFFFFYSNFEFSLVICPITSESIARKEFFSKSKSMDREFEFNSTIAIQDPLNLNWNVAAGVSFEHCKRFKRLMLLMCEVYRKDQLWQPSTDHWGLISLFPDLKGRQNHELSLS